MKFYESKTHWKCFEILLSFITKTKLKLNKTWIWNEGKSAASFYHWVVAWFPYMFCNFYLVKNHKIVKNSTTTKAWKNKYRFGMHRIL